MKFAIVNLGCKVNRVESDSAAALLLRNGLALSETNEADLIVVNTCAVTGDAEKKTRKSVRHVLRENPHADVLVTGCASALRPEVFAAMSPRVECVPKIQLEERLERFCESWNCSAQRSAAEVLRYGGAFPTRVGVKVQDGCNNACTYCIVHVARGAAWSRSAAKIVEECVAYARAGVKEIVLTGINLGSYRDDALTDNESNEGLAALCRQLLEATADLHGPDELPCRFRISSVEPCDIEDELIELLAAANGRICRHLHLPLQSGCTKVLREMDRPYDAAYFCDLVQRLRTSVPTISLSTDIIVGFPGETEEDFDQTLAVARECGFSRIHVFPYSEREGTPAAERVDQVRPEIRAERAQRLRKLGLQLREADLGLRAGTSELALVERKGLAMTESYFEVPVSADVPTGTLLNITV